MFFNIFTVFFKDVIGATDYKSLSLPQRNTQETPKKEKKETTLPWSRSTEGAERALDGMNDDS